MRPSLWLVQSAIFLTISSASLASGQYVPFKASDLRPSDDCRAMALAEREAALRIEHLGPHPAMIAPPEPNQDYEKWLAAVRGYREKVSANPSAVEFYLDYQGVRGWLRLDTQLAKRLAIRNAERLKWQFELLSLDGNNKLCLAFDLFDANDQKTGWSTVLSTVDVPQDGKWHTVTADVLAPEFDASTTWIQPIFGMDGTHDPTRGRMYIRQVSLMCNEQRRAEILESNSIDATLDRHLYDRPDLQWLATNFACHFTFMYDRSFYNPESGEFTVESFLNEGLREFGGYDSLLLWHAYPRIGIDERNQLDFYRDMPGGLEGMRRLVHEIQRHGLKVFINYNPWDLSTRREPTSTMQALAEITSAMDADGIFLDTLAAGSDELRELVDQRRPGVVLVPELFPSVEDLSSLMGSWYQFGESPSTEPGLLHHKWIQPRHMHFQISRWKGIEPDHIDPHYQEIENAYFNGSGMMIWENIFGSHNPWRSSERTMWCRAVRILRAYADHFVTGDWQPYYPTDQGSLFAHRWTTNGQTVFTLVNKSEPFRDRHLLTISAVGNRPRAFDLWRGAELELSELGNDRYQIVGSIDRLGGILVTHCVDAGLSRLLEAQKVDDGRGSPAVDLRNVAGSVMYADSVARTEPALTSDRPDGMVYVPGAMFTMHVQHPQREPGCFPDPGTTPVEQIRFLKGSWGGTLKHTIGPFQVHPFFIDETEVTNAQFQEFLAATGYRPKSPQNFLKHWPDGELPGDLAEHPVVYVDLYDARAFAKWAGKRLPTEEEWHLAAQGIDGRKWPWGNEDVTARHANLTGNRTVSVRSCPDGRSPYGCFHMSGNVYEWTESCRSDGHTQFVMIRGGSYFDPKSNPTTSSYWYTDGGPQPCDHHAKFILMYPGLDRCSTIGFRCVKDAKVDALP